MRLSYRSIASSSACALAALSALALAQTPADLECRKTETQAECHDRLKCKPDEELTDCQNRLKAAKQGNGGRRDDPGNAGNARDTNDSNRNGTDRGTENPGGESRDRGGRSGEQHDRDEGATSRRQRGSARGGGHHGFEANKTFGLGLELGEPSGLNGKYFVSESGALDFGVGYIYDTYYYGDGFHIYGDYLWHPTSLVSAPAFELPFYIGAGLRFWDFQYCYLGVCNYDGSAIGIRVPLGIAFDFNNVPLDIFIQIVPVLDFVGGDYFDRFNDRVHLAIDSSVGIRFWFK